MQDSRFRAFLAGLIDQPSFRQQAIKISARHGLRNSQAIAESPAFKRWVQKAIADVSGKRPA